MRVHILGCSGGIGKDLRTTCIRVDQDILIDCGTGAADLSLDDMRQLRHVYITHTHLDHWASLPLLVDTIFEELKSEPLTIYALPENIETLKKHVFNWSIWPDFSELPSKEQAVIRFQPMLPGDIMRVGQRDVEMIEVQHSVPGVGYYLEDDASAFAFSGDTAVNDTFWSTLNTKERLNLLIVECAFPDKDIELANLAKHYCPQTLAEDLKKCTRYTGKVTAYITHLKPGAENAIMADLAKHMPQQAAERLYGGEVFEL